jgi:hypothetical protein
MPNARGKPFANTLTLMLCCSAVSNTYEGCVSITGAMPMGGWSAAMVQEAARMRLVRVVRRMGYLLDAVIDEYRDS